MPCCRAAGRSRAAAAARLALVVAAAAAQLAPRAAAAGAAGCVYKFGDSPLQLHDPQHWTYDRGGDDWQGADAAGTPWACLTGRQQSPINLPAAAPASAAALGAAEHRAAFGNLGSLVSNGSNLEVVNNGHSVQVAWAAPAAADAGGAPPAPRITLQVKEGGPLLSVLGLQPGDKAAAVAATPRQFHFHAHSEHLVGGTLLPLEAHLVSEVEPGALPGCGGAGGCLVVAAVLFELSEEAEGDNPWLAPLFDAMPDAEGGVAQLPAGARLDLGGLLPANTTYWAYGGSLTTPPCTEGVLWLVMAARQRLSPRQWRKFLTAVADSNCTLSASGGGGGGGGGVGSAAPDALPAGAGPGASARLRRLRQLRRPAGAPTGELVEEQGAPSYRCTKLGAGSNYRLPQPLNGRALRLWPDPAAAPAAAGGEKKRPLPDGGAAGAAGAGAVAGAVLGATLGGAATALAGYYGWRAWSRRRLKRFYSMAAGQAADMALVVQEVESQWPAPGVGGSSSSGGGGAFSPGAGALQGRASRTSFSAGTGAGGLGGPRPL